MLKGSYGLAQRETLGTTVSLVPSLGTMHEIRRKMCSLQGEVTALEAFLQGECLLD